MDEKWEKIARLVEFNWWAKRTKDLGTEEYKKDRENYFFDIIPMFNGKFVPKGDIINIGTGLMSIFEFIKIDGRKVEVDPLIDDYCHLSPSEAFEARKSTSGLEDKSFDTVLCLNTIDHTSEPEKMVSEMHRVMKDDGTLYLEVNFDRYASPAHYQVFSKETVQKLFGSKFKIIFESMNKDCGRLKNWDEYYAIMVKA